MTQSHYKKVLITGNEALALGALKAGLKFYSAYPMTPASSILHFMAAHEHDYKIIVKHTEDEIAAINITIGASLAGARAMCATSGGGFALMVEGFGFGAIIETPFVCTVATRPGPATGMPTWTGQGDLRFVMHAAQDEAPRVILAPGDPGEAFQCAYKAFNLADRYQMPVILLSDKFLAESFYTVMLTSFSVHEPIDRGKVIAPSYRNFENRNTEPSVKSSVLTSAMQGDSSGGSCAVYKRYDTTYKDGISPRPLPGTPGHLFLANSDEHDEYGYSEEDAENRILQMNKRMRKMDTLIKNKDFMKPSWYGDTSASTTLITWGSTKNSCVEALQYLKSTNVLHFQMVHPLDVKMVEKELKKVKRGIAVELNYSGIFADYLCERTGYKVDQKILKYDGRPFFAEELVRKLS